LQPPSSTHWFGSDNFGRDIYSRTLYGARVSLVVGASVALASLIIGTALGLVIGFYRRIDTIMMRVMDGLMAIPAILLALALMALMKGSVRNVIIALIIPEIPRVIRLVRASVLSLREHTMVEGARALGAQTPRILLRYILPALTAPLIVQATYICAAAILIEAALSFLGAGTPPEITARIASEVSKALAESALKERYAKLGLEPVGGTPADIQRQYREDYVKYGRLIRELGIRLE